MKKLLTITSMIIAVTIGMGIGKYPHYVHGMLATLGKFVPLKHMGGATPPVAAMQAVPVTALTIHTKELDVAEEFVGRTSAYKVAEIRPQVSGIITERLFTEGSSVEKGQQLYQIDPSSYLVNVSSAKAELSKAEALVKATQAKASRYKSLVKIGAVSKQDFDDIEASLAQANANVEVAKAALEAATINLDYTKVYAPISGRISKSAVTAGALVNSNQQGPLASITQLDPIYVDVTQASEELQRLRPELKGQQKRPIWLMISGQEFAYQHQGELQFSDVTVDPSTGSVQLRALFPNGEEDLLPGMFVRAKINIANKNAILVPQKATIRGADGNLQVWLINADNTAILQTIHTKKAIGDSWLVSSGLNDGDKIVIEGVQKVRPGAVLSVTEVSVLGVK